MASDMNDTLLAPDNERPFLRNPFVVKSPEELTKEQIVRLFVPEHTKIEAIKERKHTFIWGSRGSGKSMMLRFLEPQCQALACGGTHEAFFGQERSFLAVYCPCKEGHLNKSELDLLDEFPRMIVTEHLLNLTIAERTLATLRTQIPLAHFPPDALNRFSKRVLGLFDRASIMSSVSAADEEGSLAAGPLEWLTRLFAAELSKLSRYLRTLALRQEKPQFDATATGYHDFLLPFTKLTSDLMGVWAKPLYLLIDDADRLTEAQQRIVNTWIANRDQRHLCVKVSARRDGYKTFLTRDGVDIEDPHDYSTVDVNELYTQSKSDYARKVELIANRRLHLSVVPTKDIQLLLPPDPTQEGLLHKMKEVTAAEWGHKGQPGRKDDYVVRLAMARLFQELRRTKQRRNYAGFFNIVHLSAGVVRDFLEPCYLMFDRLLDQGKTPEEVVEIPPSVQDKVLFEHSEELVLHKFEDIRRGVPPEQRPDVDALETLISSLGQLFYERLHDPEAREARLFSFTIRGPIPENIQRVLTLGERHRYLLLRTYSKKEGGGRERWYVLNRRICPAFKLDPTGFEGRISIPADLLQLACQNPDKFVSLRLKRETPEEPPTLFSLQEESP